MESVRHSPDELFFAEMHNILIKNPSTRFYLATDDEGTKSAFRHEFGERVLTSKNKANRNTCTGVKDAVTEMAILASTTQIFGSYFSSFSEAAAMLGTTPFKQLYR